MKWYILGFLACMQGAIIFCKLDVNHKKFHKKFLKWENQHITSSSVHKKFMNDFIAEYKKYYQRVAQGNDQQNKEILALQQAALQNIMDNWDSFYKSHIPLKALYDSVKTKYKDSKKFQNYFNAYEAYDKNPKDPKSIKKLEEEQRRFNF
jgi:hypothetical protein